MAADLIDRLRLLSRTRLEPQFYSAVYAALTAAADAIEAAREDAERLDWLEATGRTSQFTANLDNPIPGLRWFDSLTPGSDHSPTLRVAIDAARAQDASE